MFINIIKECFDGRIQRLEFDDLQRIAVHRITFDFVPPAPQHAAMGLSARKQIAIRIARAFQGDPEIASYTGGSNAYSWLVDPCGDWFQVTPMTEKVAHARRFNIEAIGVGVIGDFRKHRPEFKQYAGLIAGLATLCPALDIVPGHKVLDIKTGAELHQLAGHDELPGASAPGKQCPGKYLPMGTLREDVALEIGEKYRQMLVTGGVEI